MAGDELDKDAWALASELGGRFDAHVQKLHAEPPFTDEGPGDAILHKIKSWHADLVVMATHGRSGLSRLMAGSVTEAVIKASPAPVLAVRGPARPIRSILLPAKFALYSEIGFRYGTTLAALLGARVTALHVEKEPDPWINSWDELVQLIQRLPDWVIKTCRPEPKVIAGDPIETLVKESTAHDLMVLTSHRKGRLHDAALGTTVDAMIRRCDAPILAVPAPHETEAVEKRLRELLAEASASCRLP